MDEHPDIELTAVNPPFFYGPFAPGHRSPFEGTAFSRSTISTMGSPFFHNFIRADAPPPPIYFTDVRDVARALVAALKAPPRSQVIQKRILLLSPRVQMREIATLIAKERPELAHRVSKLVLNDKGRANEIVDNKRLKGVLGLGPTPWATTILDALVMSENEWKARGVDISAGVVEVSAPFSLRLLYP